MKLIKKTYNGVVPNGKVLNSDSQSLTDTYSCDYINNILGNIQIISMQYITLATSSLAAQGNAQVSGNFNVVDNADGYIAIPINYNWFIPTGVSITGNTLSCILLNPFNKTTDGNCLFIILAYKNK